MAQRLATSSPDAVTRDRDRLLPYKRLRRRSRVRVTLASVRTLVVAEGISKVARSDKA